MSDLRDSVAALFFYASGGPPSFWEAWTKTDDPQKTKWLMYADAAISLIRSETLEEAARVADAIGNASENYRDPDVYREACENVASAIRALKEKTE